jgi:hypothetical protein
VNLDDFLECHVPRPLGILKVARDP